MAGMSRPTRFRWNFDRSFETSVEEHVGQATKRSPLEETSSSNRCSHDVHW
jgi:hypothetical protein